MSAPKIFYSSTDIATSSVQYGDVRNNLSGKGKNVPITYRDAPSSEGVRLVLQTPKMSAPFGLDTFVPDEPGAAPKYSITASFKGMEQNPKMQAFHDLLQAVDKRNVDEAFAHQSEWFGGAPKTREIIEDRYHNLVKPATNDKYSANVRLKMTQKNNTFEARVFDENSNEVGTDYITPHSHIVCLLELGQLWIADKAFGQTIKCIQIKVFRQSTIDTYSIRDDPEDQVMNEYDETEENY